MKNKCNKKISYYWRQSLLWKWERKRRRRRRRKKNRGYEI